MLTVEKHFQSNVQNDNSNDALSNMIDIAALADRVQEFIDNLASESSEDVVEALNHIADAAGKIDIVAYMRSTDSAYDDAFVAAILSLPKYVATIIAVYMLGSF